MGELSSRPDLDTLRNAFAAAPFGMVVLDGEGRYLHANPAACAVLGRAEEDLHRENILSLIHPDQSGAKTLEDEFRAIERLWRGDLNAYETEVKCFHPHSGSIWLRLRIGVVCDESRRAVFYLAQLEDITATKRVAVEKQQLQEAVRRAEAMAAMGALVGGVAHEVRNPLFGITATIDAMENRLGNLPEHARYVNVLRAEANRMTELMQRLLAFGRPVASERQRGSLPEVLRAAADICSITAAGKQVRVEVAVLDSADYAMDVDKPRLIAAFQNLIDNGIQFSSPGGHVMVRLRRTQEPDGNYALVTIRDAGPGFTVGDETRIFQPFFTKRPGGTGLGLAIVQQTIEEHGGQISAGNHPEGGAELTVRLPLAD
jgi:PAS domain S-box-containing protein